jgi:hypothetical protein
MARTSKSTDSIELSPIAPRGGNSQPAEGAAIPFARLRVEYWPVERLKPYERNPRKNDKAVDKIRASIREFGFADSRQVGW